MNIVAGHVELRGSAARVCLMDIDHYQAYLDASEYYEYHGGFYNSSPIVLEVPYDDYWYPIVDSYRRIKVEVAQIFD